MLDKSRILPAHTESSDDGERQQRDDCGHDERQARISPAATTRGAGPGTTFREMRALAERRAREDELALSPGERDFEQLTHELSVHQIELQLQNEQLRAIQRELEESRDRYRDLFEHAPLGYVALRFDGIVERANRRPAPCWAGRKRN